MLILVGVDRDSKLSTRSMEVQGEAILQFLTRWKEYSPVQQRKAAAILGALVADAAGRLT